MGKRLTNQGFTLLELSVVLVIIATVVGSVLALIPKFTDKTSLDDTNSKMAIIQQALLDYRRAFGRLPCPGDITRGYDTQYFGVEAATPGLCTGGTPAATALTAVHYSGMVPTKTLGLPDDMAFDSNGFRFTYAVDIRMTATGAFANTTLNFANETASGAGIIRVNDASGVSRTQNKDGSRTDMGVYVLISHGASGHGAYNRDGSRLSFGVSDAATLENCNCTSTAAAGTLNNIYVQKPMLNIVTNGAATFDDIVVFKTRVDLLGYSE